MGCGPMPAPTTGCSAGQPVCRRVEGGPAKTDMPTQLVDWRRTSPARPTAARKLPRQVLSSR